MYQIILATARSGRQMMFAVPADEAAEDIRILGMHYDITNLGQCESKDAATTYVSKCNRELIEKGGFFYE